MTFRLTERLPQTEEVEIDQRGQGENFVIVSPSVMTTRNWVSVNTEILGKFTNVKKGCVWGGN